MGSLSELSFKRAENRNDELPDVSSHVKTVVLMSKK